VLKNIYFEQYYKKILWSDFNNEENWGSFHDSIKEKLPVTFRINPHYANFTVFKAILDDETRLKTTFFSDANNVSDLEVTRFKD